MVHYYIGSSKPTAHYFDVRIDIENPDPKGQVLRMPAWIPGSYMIRDFARNVIDLQATAGNAEIQLRQLDKSSWQLPANLQSARIEYRVYAWDLSVRGAHLDSTHGFYNGSSVFLEVVGQSERPCRVRIERPEHAACEEWRLATTLPRIGANSADEDFGFGEFEAENYAMLIDCPVEMGNFQQVDFHAGGIRHDVVLTGRVWCDSERLKRDLASICEQHIELFGSPPPMQRYLFLVMVVGEGYGGLEHRDSTALMCSRNDLPQPGQSEVTEGYRGFLGLCSHEYFHSWNVKRIRPVVFTSPDLAREVYTPLLWAFEGITSYYDDLALVRSGCIDDRSYLELLARTLTRLQRNPGRQRQSVAESSFNAWTKFYKQDENALNAIVSYYAKGSLVALCIDLKIRQLTRGEKSLDDVMRRLWKEYREGKTGIEDEDVQAMVCAIADTDLGDFLDLLIHGTDDPPVEELLATVSVTVRQRPAASQQDKGGKEESGLPSSWFGGAVVEDAMGIKIQSVVEDGPAQRAGLSAQDVIIAINDIKASLPGFSSWLKVSQPASQHRIAAFRRDELMSFDIELGDPPRDTVMLDVVDSNDSALNSWLHGRTG